MISAMQNVETILLDRVFHAVQPGRFSDIGAYDLIPTLKSHRLAPVCVAPIIAWARRLFFFRVSTRDVRTNHRLLDDASWQLIGAVQAMRGCRNVAA